MEVQRGLYWLSRAGYRLSRYIRYSGYGFSPPPNCSKPSMTMHYSSRKSKELRQIWPFNRRRSTVAEYSHSHTPKSAPFSSSKSAIRHLADSRAAHPGTPLFVSRSDAPPTLTSQQEVLLNLTPLPWRCGTTRLDCHARSVLTRSRYAKGRRVRDRYQPGRSTECRLRIKDLVL
jgi:hypothetical protein